MLHLTRKRCNDVLGGFLGGSMHSPRPQMEPPPLIPAASLMQMQMQPPPTHVSHASTNQVPDNQAPPAHQMQLPADDDFEDENSLYGLYLSFTSWVFLFRSNRGCL